MFLNIRKNMNIILTKRLLLNNFKTEITRIEVQ